MINNNLMNGNNQIIDKAIDMLKDSNPATKVAAVGVITIAAIVYLTRMS